MVWLLPLQQLQLQLQGQHSTTRLAWLAALPLLLHSPPPRRQTHAGCRHCQR